MTERDFYTIHIPGPPVSWARTNTYNGRQVTDKRVRQYKRHVAECVRFAVHMPLPWQWFDVTVHVTRHTRQRCDLDNAAKGVIDACNGLIWPDDSMVSRLEIIRHVPSKESAGILLVVSEGHLRYTKL